MFGVVLDSRPPANPLAVHLFQLAVVFVTDSRGSCNRWGWNPRMPSCGRTRFFSIWEKTHVRINFLFPGVVVVGSLWTAKFLAPEEESFVIQTKGTECISFLIDHMTKNYSTNKGYDNSSVRGLGVPPYQVGTSKLAGNAWNVHHTDLMVLLSSPPPGLASHLTVLVYRTS